MCECLRTVEDWKSPTSGLFPAFSKGECVWMIGYFLFPSILIGLIKDTVYKHCIASDLNFPTPYSKLFLVISLCSHSCNATIPLTISLIWPKHSTILVQPQGWGFGFVFFFSSSTCYIYDQFFCAVWVLSALRSQINISVQLIQSGDIWW